jgi:uncharacterized membrane protein YeaQ/YmgE (transglycosylase-associated protein family)
MNDYNTKRFVDGVRESIPEGWVVDDVKLTPTVFPRKDSSKLTITMRLPNNIILYAHGYIVVGAGRSYILQVYSPATTEPPEFTAFAGSLVLLPPPKGPNQWSFYAFVVGIILVVQVIPIWISMRAKPLIYRPYRWGTYVGIITGIIGAYWASMLFSASDIYGRETGIALCCSAVLCSVGILRRRKYGVIMFVTTYLLLIMAVPFMRAMRNEPLTPEQQGQSFPTLVFLGLTLGYFVKRWPLMGKAHDAMTPQPVPPLPPSSA